MIDLHTHSTRSDGTETPSELVISGQRAGLEVIGIADHDTVSGWHEAQRVAHRAGLGLVRGAEFTTTFAGASVHILGYLFNPASAELTEHMESVQSRRIGRARQITERLAVDFAITWDDVVGQTEPGATIGRPHIADALVRRGIVPDRTAAFEELLATNSPYYVEQHAPQAGEVIRWINAAGGRAVLAHPLASSRGFALTFDQIEELASSGLFGVEVNHRDNPPALRGELRAVAGKLGLAEFGSSDYHGTGKPNALGENTTEPSVFNSLITGAFLEV